MRHYSIWQAIPLSFFSASLYRDVMRHWGGAAFAYLVLLVALSSVPLTMSVVRLSNDYVFEQNESGTTLVQRLAYRFADKLPPMHWHDDKLEVKAPQPYKIYDQETGILILIDTTGKIKSLEESGAQVLVTADQIMFKKNEHTTEVHSLKDMLNDVNGGDVVFDKDTARAMVTDIADAMQKNKALLLAIVGVVVYLVLSISYFVGRLISVLIYALVSMIFGLILRTPVDYAALMRVACVAITPAIALDVLATLIGLNIVWLVYIVITLGYMFFAVRANKPQTEEELD